MNVKDFAPYTAKICTLSKKKISSTFKLELKGISMDLGKSEDLDLLKTLVNVREPFI